MGFQVSSFGFGSLLTSAKMTAMQDNILHIMSHFSLEHTWNNSTMAGSHNSAIIDFIALPQTFTAEKTFGARLIVGNQLRPTIQLVGNGGTARSGLIHVESDGASLRFATNENSYHRPDVAAGVSMVLIVDENNGGIMIEHCNHVVNSTYTRIAAFTAGYSDPIATLSAYIPVAGQTIGGRNVQQGTTTLTTSTTWQSLRNNNGQRHVDNFIVTSAVTLTGSINAPIMIYAVGSIDIAGTIQFKPSIGVFSGGLGAAGMGGVIGGTGGGGGSSLVFEDGGDGGRVFVTNGGSGSTNPDSNGLLGLDCSSYFLHVFTPHDVSSTAYMGMYGGQGGGGGGGEGGTGGLGGGIIYLEAPLITISGALSTVGGVGGNGAVLNKGGGGGGGGGIIYLCCRTYSITGSLYTTGGSGGISQGTGSHGAKGGDGLFIVKLLE